MIWYDFLSRINSTDTIAIGAYNPGVNCGPPVSETKFDYLPGIANRKQHPAYPEPEVALIFKQNEFDDPNLEDIENSLKEALLQVNISINSFRFIHYKLCFVKCSL